MNLVKRYRVFLSKTLLVAGYILLFATQVNNRFYSIANFFEYHHNSRLTTAGGEKFPSGNESRNGDKGRDKTAALQINPGTRNAAHLGLDKRYSAKHFISLPSINAPVVASHEVIERKYALLLKVYSTSDLPTNALRGPPVA